MHPYSIAILAGLLLGSGTVWYVLWPLSLGAFALVTHIVTAVKVRHQRVRALMLTSAIAYAFSFYGIYFETMPLDWLGLPNVTALGILTSIWLITIAIFSVSFTLLFSWGRTLTEGSWIDVYIIASLYVLADTLGTFLYSLVFYGQGARIGPHFSMGSPGYQLADSTALLQLGEYGGIYALLFTQAFVGSAGYLLYTKLSTTKAKYIGISMYASAILMIAFIPLSVVDSDESTAVSVGVVSLYDTKHETGEFRIKLLEQLQTLPSNVGIIALPEDSRFIQYLNEDEAELLSRQFSDTYILDSGTLSTSLGLAPEIQYFTTTNQAIATSSKEFLMIFGEYMPKLYAHIGVLIGQGEVVRAIQENHGYTTSDSYLFTYDTHMISAKLCSDAMSPVLYAREAVLGASVLFNLASHGWFHRSELLYELSKRVGKVRAVESRRWYVRAAYETPAFVLNEKGQVVAESDWHEDTTLNVQVYPQDKKTVYSQMRFMILLLPVAFLSFCYLRRQRARIHAS